jgi:hypothetical protein
VRYDDSLANGGIACLDDDDDDGDGGGDVVVDVVVTYSFT